MSAPPVPPAGEIGGAAESTPDAPNPGPLRSSFPGARTGLRRTSYVAAPIAILAMVPGLSLTALGVGSGRGWPFVPGTVLPPILYRPIGFYLACGFSGLFIGGFLGLIGRGRPGSLRTRWVTSALRPIRPFGQWRIGPDASAVVPPGRRRLWRWLIGVPASIAVLATAAAFAAGIMLGGIVDRRLADAIAKADRDDPSWRFDDLMAAREPVPNEENSALVVAGALELIPEGWPVGPVGAAYDRIASTPDNVRLDDATADALRDDLDEDEAAVRIARTLVDYRRGRHELEIGPTLLDTPLPETQEARTAARLLSADAAIRALDGDLDGALDSCRAILGVGRSIGDEPFLISLLVRAAIGEVALNSARRALGQGEPSDAALARLQAALLDESARPLLTVGMRGERAILYEIIRRIGADELPISALSDAPAPAPGTTRDRIAPWGRLMFDNQRAVGLEWLNEAVDITRRPAAARRPRWEAWKANIARVKDSRHGFISSTLPILMTPAISASESAEARYQAGLESMAILLAAERHRRKIGDWPASIAAIDPAILPNPPDDPFSGRAYRMERRDGQLLIYSIGPNLEDEHGAFVPKRWKNGGPDDVGTGAWDASGRGRPAVDHPAHDGDKPDSR